MSVPEIKAKINFNFTAPSKSMIKVIGVGGGGSNAVNYMYLQGIKDVDFMVCNTDAQALEKSPVPNRIQLGPSLTGGRGAGALPERGKEAALESLDDIRAVLGKETEMVFITAGMGGGTGTGAAPIIAQCCREMGILTVGIVSMPFQWEGPKRINQAKEGLEEIRKNVDTLLVILNDNLRGFGNLTLSEAFSKADSILTIAAKGIAEIVTIPGYINVDMEDVKTVMRNSGTAILGSGSGEGEERAVSAIEEALQSPLLDDKEIYGAQSILLNISSGDLDVTMDEISLITDYIQRKANNADIIWGNNNMAELGKKLQISIIATRFLPSEKGKKITSQLGEETEENLLETEVQFKPDNEVTGETRTSILEPAFAESIFGNDNNNAGNTTRKSTTLPVKQQQLELTFVDADIQQDLKIMQKSTGKTIYVKNRGFEDNIDFDELERTPAYLRRNQNLKDVNHSSKPEASRYHVSNDEANGLSIKPNPYLHDNVD